MRAVIVGPGVMGELMGKAWGEVLPEGELVFLGKGGERARFLAERYGGRAAYAVAETPPGDWVFLTLKPQTAVRVLPTLRPLLLPHSVVLSVLSALGEVIWVEEERYMDMATALSGTRPAYMFIFMEALIDAGVHMGLPRHLAEKMVVATLRGSVRYYEVAQKSIATLRHEVTSPGGTTAEAMYRLEKAGFRPALSRAVWAAYQRALSLSPDTAEGDR